MLSYCNQPNNMIASTISNYDVNIAPIKYIKSLNWYSGIMYCNFIEIDGYTDWYMPSREELNVLMRDDQYNSYVGWYWSNTDDATDAWALSTTYAQTRSPKDEINLVRPIRKVDV